jgi:hypothetical protein
VRWLLLALCVACSGSASAPVSVHAEGTTITVDGDVALRALVLDLSWDPSLAVTEITAGPDANRLDLIRTRIEGTTARVLLSDTRKLTLPQRGTILTLTATGTGNVRIVSADGAGTQVEIK